MPNRPLARRIRGGFGGSVPNKPPTILVFWAPGKAILTTPTSQICKKHAPIIRLTMGVRMAYKSQLKSRDFYRKYIAYGPENMAYEHPLLCHMNRFYRGWGWSLIAAFSSFSDTQLRTLKHCAAIVAHAWNADKLVALRLSSVEMLNRLDEGMGSFHSATSLQPGGTQDLDSLHVLTLQPLLFRGGGGRILGGGEGT